MRSEASLIQQAQLGNADAFDRLVQPLLSRAYRTAYLITHDPGLASDALQEALIRAFRSLEKLRTDSPVYPWFARIVVNEALKQCRGRRKYSLLPLPEMADPTTPETALVAREEQEQLWQAVQELSRHHRAVIVLRYYEELSEAEMAALLEISPGTVKSRLFHARAALDRRLRSRSRPSPLLRLSRILHGGDST